jgi:hypothetical protein
LKLKLWNKGILLAVFIVATSAWAESQALTFRFGKKSVRFRFFKTEKVLISESCGRDLSQMSCDAAKALTHASWNAVPSERKRGQNPGSLICLDVLHGTEKLGKDRSGNENTFCLFGDGSMIDNSSLFRAGQER